MKKRILTGLVAAALILALLYFLSPTLFFLVIAVVFSAGGYEWASMSAVQKRPLKVIYALSQFAGILIVGFYVGLFGDVNLIWMKELVGAACLFWAITLLWVLSYPKSALIWSRPWFIGLMGYVVLIPSALSMFYLLQQPYGKAIILCLLAFVTLADTGAYFFGRQWGKRKLCPSVSPGKSWVGLFGGLFSVAFFTFILAQFYRPFELSVVALVAVALVTVLSSVLGDLVESMVKRQAGKKDSGSLLPGHGGIMDRIDSMTAAAPVFVLLTLLISGS